LSLMEHPHFFVHATVQKDGLEQTALELWPISRRTAHTVVFAPDYSGPITVSFENDQTELPIIMVLESVGWRPSYDEPRLHEAIGLLLSATGAFGNAGLGGPTAVLTPHQIGLERTAEGVLLSVSLVDGGRIGIRIPKHVVPALAEKLKNESDNKPDDHTG